MRVLTINHLYCFASHASPGFPPFLLLAVSALIQKLQVSLLFGLSVLLLTLVNVVGGWLSGSREPHR